MTDTALSSALLVPASLLFCALAVAAQQTPGVSYPPSDLNGLNAADRVLIVAPHPDDETLCCAGVIRRALSVGAQVEIVWITMGDAFELDAELVEHALRPTPQRMRNLGILRAHEGRNAARTLGLADEKGLFLGYPDRGVLPLLLDHYYSVYTSPYTHASSVWYEGAFALGTLYEGRNLQRDLERVIDRIRPTRVLAPTPLDEHPDHRAAGELVVRIFAQRDQLDLLRFWIVHGGKGWPAPRGLHLDAPVVPPRRTQGMAWQIFRLTDEERDYKLRALGAYHTQLQAIPRFLRSFVRRSELFARTPLPP